MQNVNRETYIMTDEAAQYHGQFRSAFLGHGRVNHAAGEYGRGHLCQLKPTSSGCMKAAFPS
jgi:hypothetical protein